VTFCPPGEGRCEVDEARDEEAMKGRTIGPLGWRSDRQHLFCGWSERLRPRSDRQQRRGLVAVEAHGQTARGGDQTGRAGAERALLEK
jgi:hypothetical protein